MRQATQKACGISRQQPVFGVHEGTCRAAGIALPTLALFTVGFLLAPRAAGTTFETAVPTFFGDDNHTAKVNPYPAIAVSTIVSPPGECPWINTGTSLFKTANPADGTGPSHAAWNFNWAGVADEAKIEAGISITDYYPFVVKSPAVTGANGKTYAGNAPGEYGGAVMNLKYTPQPGAPALPNLHWMQGLTGTIRGNSIPTGLDNFSSLSTFTRDNTSPFYDGGLTPGVAGTLADGGGYFVDRPLTLENEYELNPIADVQFQVILASDSIDDVGGVATHTVTMYGGEWWGYQYSATDVPEPTACAYLAFATIGLLRRRRPAR